MNLREILTEKISVWEEGLVAALFLSGMSVEELSLNIEVKNRVQISLQFLQELPWSYAKEICYAISKGSQC